VPCAGKASRPHCERSRRYCRPSPYLRVRRVAPWAGNNPPCWSESRRSRQAPIRPKKLRPSARERKINSDLRQAEPLFLQKMRKESAISPTNIIDMRINMRIRSKKVPLVAALMRASLDLAPSIISQNKRSIAHKRKMITAFHGTEFPRAAHFSRRSLSFNQE